MDDVVFDLFTSKCRIRRITFCFITSNRIGGYQHITGIEESSKNVNPCLVFVVVKSKGHDATILETATSLGPASRQGLAVKFAGGLRAVERIWVFLLQGIIASQFTDAGQMFQLNEGSFFMTFPVVGMLCRIINGLERLWGKFGFKIGSFGQALIPLAQRQSKPDMEEVGQVGVEEVVPERGIGDHQIELFVAQQ